MCHYLTQFHSKSKKANPKAQLFPGFKNVLVCPPPCNPSLSPGQSRAKGPCGGDSRAVLTPRKQRGFPAIVLPTLSITSTVHVTFQ